MTILDYCKKLHSDAIDKRLIIIRKSDNSVLADAKILKLYNSHTMQNEMCVTIHSELLECEIDEVLISESAFTFSILGEPKVFKLPTRVKLPCIC